MRGKLTGPAWLLWPAAGLLAWIAYVLLPVTGTAALSATAGLVSVTLSLLALRRFRSPNARAWLIFAGGQTLWVIGDLWYVGTEIAQVAPVFPAWSDAAYLGGFLVLSLGLFQLTRTGRPRDLARVIDIAVIAAGLGLVYWVFVIGPIAADTSMTVIARWATAGYPIVGLLLCSVVLPIAARSGRRTPSLWLLTIGSVVALAGNVTNMLAPYLDPAAGRIAWGSFVFAYISFAGAAVQPSAHEPPGPATRDRFGKGRLAVLAASTLLVPAVLIYEGLRRQTIDWLAIALGSIALFLLVLARMSGFVAQVRRQAGQLEDMAMRDELTGLPNRRLFERRLDDALVAGSPQVAVLDLNGFKDVNDRYGHAVGDVLLQVVAGRLREALREGDLVARMGGDEFAVLVPDAPATVMDGVADRLLAALRRPIDASGHELLIDAGVGSADGAGLTDPYEVLRRADLAMYAAKAAGRGKHRRYSPDLDERASERARLGAELRTALDTGQFHLVYQPIVELPGGRVSSVESLIRWIHPERGFVSPVDFIPVAEENGLIVELGEWILENACAQAVAWRAELGEDAPKRISVNVSARQLAEPGFVEVVAAVLARTGLGAHNLIVEVTETAVFGGGQTVRAVKDLHELGVRIALDDFGTGHSSLGLLQTVPVDVLKVDKSFVDNITMAGRHAVIATALIHVSQGLGLMAVAEGVETEEQAAELYRLGYRLAQGYYFGRPAPAADFTKPASRIPTA